MENQAAEPWLHVPASSVQTRNTAGVRMDDAISVLRRGGKFIYMHHASCFGARKLALSCLLVLKCPEFALNQNIEIHSQKDQQGDEGETCGHPTGKKEAERDLVHLLTAPLDRTRERNFQQVSLFLLCSPVLSLVFLPGLRGAAHLYVVSLVWEHHPRAGLCSPWLQL